MPNTVLCDVQSSRTGLNLITEATELQKKQVNSKALGVLEGVCSDFSEATRNNNYYSKKLWENVLASEYIKEMLDTKTLFGELDHPADRDELSLQEAAICCTKLWIDEPDNCLMGTFDILPTEKGKLLKSICDYGSKIGISSRGVGDLEPDANGNNIVNEDTYYFICFDAVVQPAAVKARQNFTSLTESQKKQKSNILKTLVENVKNSENENNVKFIQNLAERLSLHENKTFVKACNEKLDLLKNNEADNIIKKKELLEKENKRIQKDLEEAYKQINSLRYESEKNNFAADLSLLRSQMNGLKSVVESSQNVILDEYKGVLEQNSKLQSDFKFLNKQVKELKVTNKNLETKLQEQVNKTQEKENRIVELNKTVEYAVEFVGKCKQVIKLQESNKNTSNKIIEELKKSNKLLESKINKLNNTISAYKTSLHESKNSGIQNEGLLESLLGEYISRKEQEFGVDLTSARSKLMKMRSLQDIDLYITEVTKHSRKYTPSNTSVMAALTEANKPTVNKNIEEDNSIVGQIFQQFNKKQ